MSELILKTLITILFSDPANPGSSVARAACPGCQKWTPLDCRICLWCGRPLPWKVTHWPQIVAERRRAGLLDWINQAERHGVVVEGHHFDYADPIINLWTEQTRKKQTA